MRAGTGEARSRGKSVDDDVVDTTVVNALEALVSDVNQSGVSGNKTRRDARGPGCGAWVDDLGDLGCLLDV